MIECRTEDVDTTNNLMSVWQKARCDKVFEKVNGNDCIGKFQNQPGAHHPLAQIQNVSFNAHIDKPVLNCKLLKSSK